MRVNDSSNVGNEIEKRMSGNIKHSANKVLFDFVDQNNDQGLRVERTNSDWRSEYSLENIKKKYPESKYTVNTFINGVGNDVIHVSEKNTVNSTYYIFKNDDSILINENADTKNKETLINYLGEIEYIEYKQVVNEDEVFSIGTRYNSHKGTITELKYNSLGEVIYSLEKDENDTPLRIVDKINDIDQTFYNGKLYNVYDRWGNKTNMFAEALYKDIKGLGTSSTISEHINLIDKDNVVEILENYELKHDSFLISDILNEVSLSKQKRIEYIKVITDSLSKIDNVYCKDLIKQIDQEIEYQFNKFGFVNTEYIEIFMSKMKVRLSNKKEICNAPNGKIDNDFNQGNIGDCWLIAPIKALILNPIGKKIIEDSIKVNDDGSVTVTLKGIDKSYTFSLEDINGNNNLSQGDMDVRAIEMAVDKYFYEQRGNLKTTNTQLDIDGNDPHMAFQILTGKGGRSFFNHLASTIKRHFFNGTITEKQIDNFNKENHFAIVSSTHGIQEDIGEEHPLYGNHAYVAVGSDSENVYLLDPKLSITKRIPVPREIFKSLFNDIAELDL